MKITKIAQGGGGIPAGFVRIEFDAGEEDQKTEILGHGPGTSCETENDDLLLQDLLNIEIEGFGPTEIEKGDLTDEGKMEKWKNKPKPINPLTLNKPKKTKAPFGGPYGAPQEDERSKADLGFGV